MKNRLPAPQSHGVASTIRCLGIALILSMLALGAWAQTSPPQHIHPNVTVVDGAIRPELIPDSTAYRLWLITVSLPPKAGNCPWFS